MIIIAIVFDLILVVLAAHADSEWPTQRSSAVLLTTSYDVVMQN